MPQTCSGSVISPGRVRSPRRLIALLVGLALSLVVISGSPAATTWTVCASGCDYASIKAAIAAPTTLDGDTLAIAAGTYTEAGIVVDKSLMLQGERAATTIVQAAASQSEATDRVFTIASGVTVTLQDLTIRHGNTASLGGGLYNAGTLTLIHSTIRGNTANGGGGLYNAGTLTLTHSTIRGNTANGESGAGGGLFNQGTATLTHSTIRGNTARWDGGGLYNFLWTLRLTHSTISGNTAGLGGGLVNDQGRLRLTHSTVTGNTANLNASGGLYNDGELSLTNSLIASHPTGGDCATGRLSSISSWGYNLDSDGSCHLTAATDRPGVDPVLGPLQDNGGPTLTHALLPGSPAIDAIPWGTNGCGTTFFSDQRWRARPQPAGGACDIGAYEVEVPGQALGGWVSGFRPGTVVCQNVTTGHSVTLSSPAPPWDCEAAGLGVRSGDQVALRVRGPVKQSATDVGGAVVGMTPNGGSCTNLTTGQQVPFQVLFQGVRGATAASCVAAGLVIHPGDRVQMRVQGVAE